MSERSERNPGITSPQEKRAREAGDRILRPHRARDIVSNLIQGWRLDKSGLTPWLNSGAATRLVESYPTLALRCGLLDGLWRYKHALPLQYERGKENHQDIKVTKSENEWSQFEQH